MTKLACFWKDIKGFEGYYQICINGSVKSIDRKVPIPNGWRKYPSKILITRLNNYGYEEVRLSKNGQVVTKFIHTLLAETFIPNPLCKKEINHKNGIKNDNTINNLEWVTHSENMLHAYRTKLIVKKTKPIIDTCSGESYMSSKEAALLYNINHRTLQCYLT